MPIDEAIAYILNICDALGYAHQRGMIHRDIKPANIMLDIYNHAILMDFGIVKIVGGTSHTVTGAVMGTARYISPEVIRAETADPRSDLYSLGVTFYEMLSGQAPFQSDSAMTLMMMHLNDPVPDPRALRADLPAGLVYILLKLLEKDRSRRYQSAAELAADLRRELAHAQPALAAPNPAPVRVSGVTVAAAARDLLPPSAAGMQENRTLQAYPTPPSNPAPSAQYPAGPPAKKSNMLLWLLGLGGVAALMLVALVAVGIFIFTRNSGAAAAPLPTATLLAVSIPVSGGTPLPAPAVADSPAAPTPPPTAAQPAADPTSTLPPLYVRINSITVDGTQYVVNYQTFGYTEKLPGMHVHFFYNTVPPDQAGMPGKGPWYLYGGPRPFTKYKVSQRPPAATQICALVAHADHSVIPNSGNCLDLPKTN